MNISDQMTDPLELLVDAVQLQKSFAAGGAETFALAGIDLRIGKGEFVAICGPSGSGKSTLLSILGLMESPTSGSYRFNGYAVDQMSVRERNRIRNQEIGFIFQAFNLIEDLTVWENVELPLTYRDGLTLQESRHRVSESLERVGMQKKYDHFPLQLSGGEQQRVAVARALAGSPSFLLADEPTGNLDSVNGAMVMRLLQELNDEGSTLCVVTHNPQFASLAQRQVHLIDGKVTVIEERQSIAHASP
jgi:putative ABC transport system ATP-binding protein